MTSEETRIAKSTIVRTEEVAKHKWLRMVLTHWKDPEGRDRIWESAERTTRRSTGVDAVQIFTIIRGGKARQEGTTEGGKEGGEEGTAEGGEKTASEAECLLVRQFRPAVGKETIEFPAGLVDEGETLEEAALRELKEETGYQGTVKSVSPVVYSDAGITNANMVSVIVEVDAQLPANQHPLPQLDDGEFITVFRVPISRLLHHLRLFAEQGYAVDSRVWNFAEALLLSSQL